MITQEQVEREINLSFKMEQLRDAADLMSQWIAQEKIKQRSLDLPTDAHKEIVVTVLDMLNYFVDCNDDTHFTAFANQIVRIFLELDALLMSMNSLNTNISMLAHYVPGMIEDEQETA